MQHTAVCPGRQRRPEHCHRQRHQAVSERRPLREETARGCQPAADRHGGNKFWPIYDQYSAEVWKIGDARVALIKEYVQSYDTMTDAQANDFMDRSAAIDQEFLALLTKYVPIFEKVISPKKTARWYQIDRRLNLLINVQLAANIPMLDASK